MSTKTTRGNEDLLFVELSKVEGKGLESGWGLTESHWKKRVLLEIK